MSLHFHFIKKCECGILISRCRCASEETMVEVVPCTHKKPTPPTGESR